MCGVVGVFSLQKNSQASFRAFQALSALQHRGQDAAGLLSYDFDRRRFFLHRQSGLISTALPAEFIKEAQGQMAIAHNRYATVAKKSAQGSEELQPQMTNLRSQLGLAHNGNIPDAARLKQHLETQFQRQFQSNNDVEILLHWLTLQLDVSADSDKTDFMRLCEAVHTVLEQVPGAYSAVGLWGQKGLFGFKDSYGLRPLALGKSEDGDWMLASESAALNISGFQFVREIKPGELVFIDSDGRLHEASLRVKEFSPCFFEHIYFSSAESQSQNRSIHSIRHELGEKLAERIRVLMVAQNLEFDVVVPVPDTSRPAAISLAERLRLPYRELLIKNRYVQRSFILPTQEQRETAMSVKLTVVRDGLVGKRVLLVDDSIVRGTTSRRIISLLRAAGVQSVTLVSTSPPITNPCYFGIDFPDQTELISARYDEAELARYLGADKVIFQRATELLQVVGQMGLCRGCISGEYPMDISEAAERFRCERRPSERKETSS